MNIGKFLKSEKILSLIITYFSGIAIYSLLITHRLVNTYDGLWKSSFYSASAWEVACGRFVWPYLDYLRSRICEDPYMSIASLLIISITLAIIDLIMDFKRWYYSVIFNLLFIANVIICVFLSYRYMSLVFAFSFLFSILSAYMVLTMKSWLGVIISGVCIMLTMGLYQANIGCMYVFVLIWAAIQIINGLEYKTMGAFFFRVFCASVIGAVLYIVFCKIHLKIYEVEMTSYRGGDSYSIVNTIIKLPSSIVKTYDKFAEYFFNSPYFVTVFQRYHTLIMTILLMITTTIVLLMVRLKKDYKRILIVIAILLLLPIASNVIQLVATEGGTSIQMTAPNALVIPLLYVLIMEIINGTEIGVSFISKRITRIGITMLACAFIYVEALQVCLDQTVMLITTRSTAWMYNETIYDLKEKKLLNSNYTYCYMGKPSGNSLFVKEDMIKWSNAYARVGEFWLGGDCSPQSWEGVVHNLGGASIQIANFKKYDEIRKIDEVNCMPIFPAEGYIKTFGDTVVVKISDDR